MSVFKADNDQKSSKEGNNDQITSSRNKVAFFTFIRKY